jgi:hypothetical protein
MLSFNLKNVALVALFAACASFGTGCYADAQAEPVAAEPVAAYGYQPQYYNGAVVYYDNGGRPYYNNGGGGLTWVPTESPYYAGYVHHYRTYGRAYGRWYAGYGRRYHGYHGYRHGWR